MSKKTPMMLELISLLRKYLQQGKLCAASDSRSVWVSNGFIANYIYAFDITPFYPQMFMLGNQEFLSNIELVEGKHALARDLCTDNKIALARCLEPDAGNRVSPAPAIAISMNLLCNQVSNCFDYISSIKKIPHFKIKLPYIDPEQIHKSDYKNSIYGFIASQFENLTSILSRLFCKNFNHNAFHEGAITYLKSLILAEQILYLNAKKPICIDGQQFVGYFMPQFLVNYLPGQADLLDFYIKLYNKICEENVDQTNNKSAEIRLYWDGHMFTHKRKLFGEVLSHYNANITMGSFASSYFDPLTTEFNHLVYPINKHTLEERLYSKQQLEERFDIDDLSTISTYDLLARIYFQLSFFKYGIKYREAYLKKIFNEFHIDGMICAMNQYCRVWSLSQPEMMSYARNVLNTPCLSIQADHFDPRCIGESQIITRIESFLENLAARKK